MIEKVIRIALEAERLIEAVHLEGLGTEEQEGGSPVTRADRAADRYL
jgi:3'-phosphoadenosine 5'-phosphosulfate (PAPS) 3'-phosphatase